MGPKNTFVFGKRKPFEGGLVKEYERLHIGPKLSGESLGALRQLCDGFSWRMEGHQEIWEPVTATFFFDNPHRVLVCRILDDGSDNIGRGHLVRVECVELQLEPSGDWSEAVGPLLAPRAWSVEEPAFKVLRKPTTGLAQPSTSTEMNCKPGFWSIAGNPSTYRFQQPSSGKDSARINPTETSESARETVRKGAGVPDSRTGAQPVPSPEAPSFRTIPPQRKGLYPAFLWILLVFSLFGMGLGGYYYDKFQKKIDAMEKENGSLGGQLEAVKYQKTELELAKSELKQKVNQLEKEKLDWKRTANPQYQELLRLKNDIVGKLQKAQADIENLHLEREGSGGATNGPAEKGKNAGDKPTQSSPAKLGPNNKGGKH